MIEVFNSLTETVTKINSRKKINTGCSENNERDGWFGTSDWTECMELIQHGDAKNYGKIKNELGAVKFADNDTMERIRGAYTPSCGSPSVPRLLMGLPNPMYSVKRLPVPAKVISVVYDAMNSCGVSQRDIVRAGALLLSAIRKLELNGVRVGMYVSIIGQWGVGLSGFITKIKDSGMPLNALNMAFPIINPSMLRRIGHRWIERHPEGKKGSVSYGVVTKREDIYKIFSDKHLPESAYVSTESLNAAGTVDGVIGMILTECGSARRIK